MHNGVLTFRYRGETEVSRVAYQMSQETCHYFQFDAWGSRRRSRGPTQASTALPSAPHIAGKSRAACR